MRIAFAARSLPFVAAALVAGIAAPTYAQSEEVITNIPFDFVVGTAHLSAGKYIVRPAFEDQSALMIQRADGRGAVFTMTIPRVEPNNAAPAEPGLTFEVRDGEHVLARVVEGDGTERELVRAHAGSSERVASERTAPNGQ